MVAEFEASTPIVLGIQAARETPRYVPVAKVRRAMKGSTIDEVDAGELGVGAGSTVSKMYKPDSGGGAEMIDGSAEDQANKIIEILTQKGIK
jgi:electron transfer flavoprotein beta subunit